MASEKSMSSGTRSNGSFARVGQTSAVVGASWARGAGGDGGSVVVAGTAVG
jgi:hypothetical protein